MIDFKHIEKSYRVMLSDAHEYVRREGTQIGPYTSPDGTSYTVRWGAHPERQDAGCVDVDIEFADSTGTYLAHRKLPPALLKALTCGFKRLADWRAGGAFPETAEELFAPIEGFPPEATRAL